MSSVLCHLTYLLSIPIFIKLIKKYIYFNFFFKLDRPTYGIDTTIRNGREIKCLPYVGFIFTFPCNSLEQLDLWSKYK